MTTKDPTDTDSTRPPRPRFQTTTNGTKYKHSKKATTHRKAQLNKRQQHTQTTQNQRSTGRLKRYNKARIHKDTKRPKRHGFKWATKATKYTDSKKL